MYKVLFCIVLIINFFIGDVAAFAANEKQQVVILHGIARSSKHMAKLADYLSNNDFEVFNIDYPSTDYTLEELRDSIYQEVNSKIDKDRIVNFVGYSMGGILVRVILNKYKFDNLGRVVQLAPPNKGSEVADFLENNWLYNKIYGPAGKQLITNQEEINYLFGKIYYDLGVIAGNSTIDPISSMIIKGDDDGKVSIDSTKIDGMKDHIVVNASHTFFPSNKKVMKQTFYFLKNGKFER